MASPLFTYIRLEELSAWLENKLAYKYSLALEGVEKRFIPVFSQFEGILNSLLEIRDIMKDSSELNSGKVYLENIL